MTIPFWKAGKLNHFSEGFDNGLVISPQQHLLGHIPLIGDVFTGGGDGVFAATYKVDGAVDDPRVVVNPLTVLTPGFTRRIVNGFGSSRANGEAQPDVVEPWDRDDQN